MNEKLKDNSNRNTNGVALKKSGFRRALTLLSWLVVIILFIVAAGLLFLNLQSKVFVDGNSMNVALSDGDVLCIDTHAQAERGDIVVVDVLNYVDKNVGFHQGEDGESFIIKRLIAVEGDKIYCENGVVYICYAGQTEFTELEEEYLSKDFKTKDFDLVEVGEDEIFVMGDNRSPGGSLDSRSVGCFKEEELVAVVPGWSYAVRGFTTFWFELFH